MEAKIKNKKIGLAGVCICQTKPSKTFKVILYWSMIDKKAAAINSIAMACCSQGAKEGLDSDRARRYHMRREIGLLFGRRIVTDLAS